MKLEHTVSAEEAGREVRAIMRGALSLSATMTARLKLADAIFVNSIPVFTNYRVSEGDVVCVDLDMAERKSDYLPEQGEIDIIFEDDYFLALNKPSGMIVHPSHTKYGGTLINYASGYMQSRGLPYVIHAVNRLDRDTSGVVLFAKNSHVMSLACRALETSEKDYLAVLYGVPEPLKSVVDLPIKRAREKDLLRIVSPDGSRAVTHYEVLKTAEAESERISLVKLRLETGRTHQIRVHMTACGHPLIGDCLYFSEESRALSEKLGVSAQLLHAGRLAFVHPFTGQFMKLTAEVKEKTFQKILEKLKFSY